MQASLLVPLREAADPVPAWSYQHASASTTRSASHRSVCRPVEFIAWGVPGAV
jgi:hypothetical protein